MNIAFFSDSYLPLVNGVASSLGLLSQRLLMLGHKVTIFAPKISRPWVDPAHVVRINSVEVCNNPPFYIGSPLSWRVLSLLKSSDVDVIHVHTPLTMGMLAVQAALLFKKPLVYTYHTILLEYLHYAGHLANSNFAKQLIANADALSCNLCNLVVAPSAKVKRFLQAKGVSTPFEVVPNGVPLQRFSEVQRGYLRLQYPHLNPADKILLFVGRLGQEKNPAFVITMLSHLLPQAPDVKLVVAGDGYLLPKLKRLADELQVASNIIFLGNVPFKDMPLLYADSDVFVSAATSEVHPMALLEAIASGLPVVAVNDDAFASAVVPGKNGFLTALDETAFAAELLKLLKNPGLLEAMAGESLRLSKKFSVETQADRLLEIYARLTVGYREINKYNLVLPNKFWG